MRGGGNQVGRLQAQAGQLFQAAIDACDLVQLLNGERPRRGRCRAAGLVIGDDQLPARFLLLLAEGVDLGLGEEPVFLIAEQDAIGRQLAVLDLGEQTGHAQAAAFENDQRFLQLIEHGQQRLRSWSPSIDDRLDLAPSSDLRAG